VLGFLGGAIYGEPGSQLKGRTLRVIEGRYAPKLAFYVLTLLQAITNNKFATLGNTGIIIALVCPDF
jgi:hypothetical protein